MNESDYERAHRHSSAHREELLRSDVCGCFHCLGTFAPAEIADWTDERDGVGTCAICPRCGVDSVIGSASGYPVDAEFLKGMHAHWFERVFTWDEETSSWSPQSE